MTVLVGYASRHGSTREIAERIAARLEENGFPAEVRAMDTDPDTGRYDAFVLGSAIHGGAWLPDAMDFVRRNLDQLGRRPLWLFSVGLSGAVGGWFEAHVKQPSDLVGLMDGLRPHGYRLFAGALEKSHFPLAGRLTYALMRGRYGDFRDWEEIGAWADGIARDLAAAVRDR